MENEAEYTLDDNTIDHGNFLELIFIGKYVCLKEHLYDCVEVTGSYNGPVEQVVEGLLSPYTPLTQ